MLEQPPPMMDPKLQLQQQEFRPTSNTGRSKQRPRSNRRGSTGAGAAANAAAAAPGRGVAVGVPGQYMQPVSCSLLDRLFVLLDVLFVFLRPTHS